MSDIVYKGIDIGLDMSNHEKVDAYEMEQEKIRVDSCKKKYAESGIPDKFKNHNLETFIATTEDEKHIKQVVTDFAGNPKNRVLLMCGKNGNGKTHLGTAIIYKSIFDGYGGAYITSSNLCIKYESAIGYKTKMNREEIIEYYSKAGGVLVIDECCKYFINSELEKFILVQIICNRYENNLPTVLISNSDKKDFIDFLGKAVYDRFTEVCSTLDFNWESKRKSLRGNE